MNDEKFVCEYGEAYRDYDGGWAATSCERVAAVHVDGLDFNYDDGVFSTVFHFCMDHYAVAIPDVEEGTQHLLAQDKSLTEAI